MSLLSCITQLEWLLPSYELTLTPFSSLTRVLEETVKDQLQTSTMVLKMVEGVYDLVFNRKWGGVDELEVFVAEYGCCVLNLGVTKIVTSNLDPK